MIVVVLEECFEAETDEINDWFKDVMRSLFVEEVIDHCVKDKSIGFGFGWWGLGHVNDVLLRASLVNDAELTALDEFDHVGAIHKQIGIWKDQSLEYFIEIRELVDHHSKFIVCLECIWAASDDLLG